MSAARLSLISRRYCGFCAALDATPNDLLLADKPPRQPAHDRGLGKAASSTLTA